MVGLILVKAGPERKGEATPLIMEGAWLGEGGAAKSRERDRLGEAGMEVRRAMRASTEEWTGGERGKKSDLVGGEGEAV